MKRLSTLLKIAERDGWSVSPVSFAGNKKEYEFAKYSNAGQDFSFCVEAESPQELIRETESYIEGYDPIEEAFKWIGPDGHGVNGAPNDPRDIIEDMEDCKRMMQELLTAWQS